VRTAALFIAASILTFIAGCESAQTQITLQDQINSLTKENVNLKSQLVSTQAKNEQLNQQVQTLSDLPSNVRLENLYDLQKVKFGRYTNIYDKDKDGKKESLIVYLRPIDDHDDTIKASAAVDVQLWDINKQDAPAMLGKWHISSAELKKLWFATVITINYKLTFDISEKVSDYKHPLLVKVTFTDYLSGKVFKEQKIIKPLD